jgi:hypothetical protein
MASPYPIRAATEDDLPAVSAVHEHAFHSGPPAGQAGAVAAKPASWAPMSSLSRPGRGALSTGRVWLSGRAHHKGPPR